MPNSKSHQAFNTTVKFNVMTFFDIHVKNNKATGKYLACPSSAFEMD